jgi:hypothetical protein
MPLPDLDELIAEVDRTCPAAHRTGEQQPDWLALLRTGVGLAENLRALADDLVEDYVEHCRLHGVSWSDIGKALGVSRQAAQQRFLAPHVKYEEAEFSAELRAAMTHMKKAAVQHRNNYIGTEHVLWGLLAEDNTATRLLATLGLSPEALRRDLEPRLTTGASQAAERIAWTPYTRRALAVARDLAHAEGTPEIGCDHFLAGLTTVGRGISAAVLGELEISPGMLAASRG